VRQQPTQKGLSCPEQGTCLLEPSPPPALKLPFSTWGAIAAMGRRLSIWGRRKDRSRAWRSCPKLGRRAAVQGDLARPMAEYNHYVAVLNTRQADKPGGGKLGRAVAQQAPLRHPSLLRKDHSRKRKEKERKKKKRKIDSPIRVTPHPSRTKG
jgi:hypothetical protein